MAIDYCFIQNLPEDYETTFYHFIIMILKIAGLIIVNMLHTSVKKIYVISDWCSVRNMKKDSKRTKTTLLIRVPKLKQYETICTKL